jgi:Flp pilus assembly protein TadD
MMNLMRKIIGLTLAIFTLSVQNSSAAEPAPASSFIESRPENVLQIEILHKKAEALILKNDLKGAVKIYWEIILLEPDDEVAYTNLGHAYMILGNFEKAKTAFVNALNINPENETALKGLEKIYDPDGTLKTRAEGGS